MLTVGEYVMKTGEGVCMVDCRLLLDLSDGQEKVPYYMLVPIRDDKSRIYVRVADTYQDIRPVISEKEAHALLLKIRGIEETLIENDRQREQIYKEALRSLDPERIVAVLKNICGRAEKRAKQGKKNTSVDERYFKLAEDALCQELGFVLKKDPEAVRSMISEAVRET